MRLPETFFIRTYGCQMNERDSESVAATLVEAGMAPAASEETADLLVFNTCSVRDQAERKAVGKLGLTSRLKRRRPEIIVGFIGCMAQNRGAELLESMPHLDFALGTDQLHRLPETIESIVGGGGRQLWDELDASVLNSMSRHLADPGRVAASIAISRGCDRFCAYCVVPYVRGREKSRGAATIVAEAAELAGGGVREILLLGQNVAAYGLDGTAPPPPPDTSPFADLLDALGAIGGLERIRFTSPHPGYFNDRLITAALANPKVCDSFHLPMQSGSDAVLRRMNRPYTIERYLRIVEQLRRGGDITFSTDIIVGFPGESDEDFAATRRAMEEVGFDNAYIFKYSPRRGTKAAEFADDVPKAVKEERNQILLDDLSRRVAAANQRRVGSAAEILVEGTSKRNPERWMGRTSNNKTVVFTPNPRTSPGDIVKVRIKRATAMTLFGELEELPGK